MSVEEAIRAAFRHRAAALGCAIALAALWTAADATGDGAAGWKTSRISTAGGYAELRGLGQTPLAGATGAQHAHVAIGGSGEAVAVWEPVGTGILLQSSTYRPGLGWSEEHAIPGADGVAARVAMDPAGDEVVLWRDALDPQTVALLSSVRRPGQGWADPVLLTALGTKAAEPELAISPTGEAIAMTVIGGAFDPAVKSVEVTSFDGTTERLVPRKVSGSRAGGSTIANFRYLAFAVRGSWCVERLVTLDSSGRPLWETDWESIGGYAKPHDPRSACRGFPGRSS